MDCRTREVPNLDNGHFSAGSGQWLLTSRSGSVSMEKGCLDGGGNSNDYRLTIVELRWLMCA